MHHPHLPARAFACLLLATGSALAAPQESGAADPQAAVPATVYQPAVDYRAAPARPDRNWRASNDSVANTNSMALTMKGMGGHDHHAMPAAPADAHAGHAMPMPEPVQEPAQATQARQPAHMHHGAPQ